MHVQLQVAAGIIKKKEKKPRMVPMDFKCALCENVEVNSIEMYNVHKNGTTFLRIFSTFLLTYKDMAIQQRSWPIIISSLSFDFENSSQK